VRGCGGVENQPVNAEGKQAGIAGGFIECAEVGLSGRAKEPSVGERRSDGGFSAVLRVIGKDAALGRGAEGLRVFAGGGDVVCIDGKEGVAWGVVARPEEGLRPGIGIGPVGEFKMRGRREGGALGFEHDGGEGNDDAKGDGTKHDAQLERARTSGEAELLQRCAEEHRHQGIEQNEDSQRLQASDEVRSDIFAREEQGDQSSDKAESDCGSAERGRCRRKGDATTALERDEDEEWGDDAEKLIRVPLGEEPVVARNFSCEEGRGFLGGGELDEKRDAENGCGKDRETRKDGVLTKEAQKNDVREGVGRHQGMEEKGQQQVERAQEQGARGATPIVKSEGDGEQREWERKTARREVGVQHHERGGSDGECPPGSEERDAGKLCGF